MESKIEELTDFDDKAKLKEKLFGNIYFIGELYKEYLLPEKIIMLVQMSLLGEDGSQMSHNTLEAGLMFINKIGMVFDERTNLAIKEKKKVAASSKANVDQIYARFNVLRNGIEKFDVGQRIQLLIQNMLDDRDNGWKNARQSVNQIILTPQQVEENERKKLQQAD